MDWPDAENPQLIIDEEDPFFEFEDDSEYTSRVLWNRDLPAIPGSGSELDALKEPTASRPQSNTQDIAAGQMTSLDLSTATQWDRWLASLNDRGGSGYHILLSARVKPVQEKPTEIATGLEYLPCEEKHWRKLLEQVPFHNVIRTAITKGKDYSTCLMSEVDGQKVEMFTAVMSSEWQDNIAISSAHFRKSNFTVAVIYGCRGTRKDGQTDFVKDFGGNPTERVKPNHMARVEKLLKRSPEVKGHPLLMPGIFEELQRDRVERLVRVVEDELDEIMRELKINQIGSPETKQLDWDWSRKLGRFRLKAKKVEEGARKAKEGLLQLINHIEVSTQDGYWPENAGTVDGGKHDKFKKNTKRFKDRFEEICNDLDSMIVRCHIAFKEVTYARELFMAELARQEAEESKRQTQIAREDAKRQEDTAKREREYANIEAKKTRQQARTSTVIAFVAMLYLPATSLATIFAMPVFDWQNRWMNVQFRDVPSGGNGDAGGGEDSRRSSPVFSAYFWIYLLFSVAFTSVTLWAWRAYTKDPEENERGSDREKNGSLAEHDVESTSSPGGHTSSGDSPLSAVHPDAPPKRKWHFRSLLGGHGGQREADVEATTHGSSLNGSDTKGQ